MIFYLTLFLGFLILFSLYGFWVATHPPRYITNLTPKDLAWKFEDVQLITQDNVKLAAWFVPASAEASAGKPSDKVIILLHGYPADKANLLYWSEFLHQDFNLFFLDFRYFGDSEGSLTTIGYREQHDLMAAIDYLEERVGFTKIGAMGFSLGGAVAILTASNPSAHSMDSGQAGSGLKAIVSDSAFANLDLMAYEFYKPLFILKYPLTLLTKVWAQIFLGINPNEVSPEKAAANLKTPILLIHSKKDQTIPFENALKIKEALKDKSQAEFFFLEQGIHGSLPTNLQVEYEKIVIEFFKKNLE